MRLLQQRNIRVTSTLSITIERCRRRKRIPLVSEDA